MLKEIAENPQYVTATIVLVAVVWAFFLGKVIPIVVHRERISDLKAERDQVRADMTAMKLEFLEERRQFRVESQGWKQTLDQVLGVLEPIVGTGAGKQVR